VKPAQPESEFVIVVEVPAEKDRPRKPLRKTHDPLAIRFYGPPDLDLF
jgi:hypothetical protein